jgi:hypothetical protein
MEAASLLPMPSETPVRLRMLRVLLAMDSTVLLALGALFMAVPAKIGLAFGFKDLAPAACYLIGLWGCALISLGVGYAYAVGDPVRNVSWVQAGIVRGALECVFGFVVLSQHMVTWNQAAFGTVIAGAIAAGYLILYPSATTT